MNAGLSSMCRQGSVGAHCLMIWRSVCTPYRRASVSAPRTVTVGSADRSIWTVYVRALRESSTMSLMNAFQPSPCVQSHLSAVRSSMLSATSYASMLSAWDPSFVLGPTYPIVPAIGKQIFSWNKVTEVGSGMRVMSSVGRAGLAFVDAMVSCTPFPGCAVQVKPQ